MTTILSSEDCHGCSSKYSDLPINDGFVLIT